MDENVDSRIPAYESTDSEINWACKICKDLPHYAEMYLLQRKYEKAQNEYGQRKIEKRTKLTHRAFYPTYGHEFYRTIRSGFYDVDHLSYASKCDYFVTCDRTLSLQATEIYRYLGYETRVIFEPTHSS